MKTLLERYNTPILTCIGSSTYEYDGCCRVISNNDFLLFNITFAMTYVFLERFRLNCCMIPCTLCCDVYSYERNGPRVEIRRSRNASNNSSDNNNKIFIFYSMYAMLIAPY